jgi:hypothetical protein
VSDRVAAATPPKLIYAVAVVFFFEALICLASVLAIIPKSFRYSPAAIATAVATIVCAACYGVYLLARQYRVASWMMYAMTAYLAFVMLSGPAAGSPFHSEARVYVNRVILLLPMAASCVYLARKR